jgi:hypothetical protein
MRGWQAGSRNRCARWLRRGLIGHRPRERLMLGTGMCRWEHPRHGDGASRDRDPPRAAPRAVTLVSGRLGR